jgi:hypothetical protein
MIVKIYAILWALIGSSAALIFAAGYFTVLMTIVYGFICFGMTFMGMLAVLPATFHVEHHPAESSIKSIKSSVENQKSLPAAASRNIESAALIAKTA